MKYLLAGLPLSCTVRYMCSDPHCCRPATIFTGLSKSEAKPYCNKHSAPSRKELRALNRLDDLLNKILLLNVKWLSHYRTVSTTVLANGTLVLHQTAFERPRALYPNPVDPVHPWARKAAWCYDSCVHALETLAGVLAYLVEGRFRSTSVLRSLLTIPGSMTVEEVHIKGVHATRRILFLTHNHNGNVQASSLAETHSMFKVSTALGDAFLDPTAPQYGRQQGWQDCKEYLQEYHRVPQDLRHVLGPVRRPIGNAYSENRDKLNVSTVDPTYDPLYCVAHQTAIRNINNIVYSYVEAAGGPRVLRSGSSMVWAQLEMAIVHKIGDWMETLRADVDQLWYRFPDRERRSDAHWTMLTSSDGQGHRKIVDILSRAHGGTLQP